MLKIPFLLPILSLALGACGAGTSEVQPQQPQIHGSTAVKGEEPKEAYPAARATRLDVASSATMPVVPLTSQDALDEYSSRLADLQFLISSAEKAPLIQSRESDRRPYVDPSLNQAKEALASGMITKGKAQLAMKDFEGARKTFLQVLVAFDPKVYGGLVRQAELALQDVENAARLANAAEKR